MTLKPRVALSREFLTAYSRLPVGIQKKVREFTEKFQQDPTNPGIHFERIQAADDKVRSVRIDQAYRAIVVHPPRGDVYLCVWVDHHDEAYRWVRNKRFEVNPASGVFQLFEVETAPSKPPDPVAPPREERRPRAVSRDTRTGLFAAHDDEALLLAGVPLPLLPSVRCLANDADLDSLRPHLPEDAAEVLYGLAMGMGLEEALTEVERAATRKPKVDVEDFAAALAEPASQRQFLVVQGDRDLTAVLNQPLAQWRVFLHPTQQRLATMQANGPVRVLGGAGTGKTVVLMHRARHLASKLQEGEKLLVTTFTRNLAADLLDNLRTLCGEGSNELRRIEVTNLHAWAMQFLTRNQVRYTPLTEARERQERMDLAIDEIGESSLPRTFFLEEWDRIVLAQEILDRDSYLTARRTGRGVRLDRRQRALAWDVFARYRQSLERDRRLEWQDVVREARLLLEKKVGKPPFQAVCADEAQDFTASELRLLRALAPRGPDDLFLVGDGHQRIYGQPVVMSQCGIDVRGRSRKLKLNYRTTDHIARRGIAILHGVPIDDLDGGSDTLRGYTSLRTGIEPEITIFGKESQEAEFVVQKLRSWIAAGTLPENICVATRIGQPLKSRYQPILSQHGIASVILEGDKEAAGPGVRLATMHRMKGLEFQNVLLANVSEGVVPLAAALASDDPTARSAALQQERCLLYVACTRARDELAICGYGRPSPFLSRE
ncbi:MAG: AAA family ATPase [Planctomycetes bacterium]|jgi:superfamily I DNA/RNA helicase|nr:AAA family ATPase [Planctomycetota bacterium]